MPKLHLLQDRVRKAAALLPRLRRFRHAVAAAAAVEFAIVAPVALLLYVGAAEVSDGVMASRRATTVTETLINLLSLQPTTMQATSTPTPANAVSASNLSSFLTSAATLMAPEPTAPLTMTISAIDITNNGQGVCCSVLVRWSYTQGGTLRPCATQITALPASSDYAPGQIPGAIIPYGIQLPTPIAYVIADVGYTYRPFLSTNIVNFAPVMQRTIYMMPRSSGQVAVQPLPSTGSQHGQICF